jgi:hypothetical protein
VTTPEDYCKEDSEDEETPNLQLRSLKEALRDWNLVKKNFAGNQNARVKEQCVSIIKNLGDSLSQLLGQQFESCSEHIPPPKKLFECHLGQPGTQDGKRQQLADLQTSFNELIDFYDACRHFGRTPRNSKHEKVRQLDQTKTAHFVQVTLDIWKIITGREINLETPE